MAGGLVSTSDGPPGEVVATEPLRLLLRDLRADPGGLTQREAQRRLVAHGPNELRRTRGRPAWREFADQLVHPLALLLWVAAGLSLVTHTPVLSLAIVVVIWLNALFAFAQERHSERAVEALSSYLPQHAVVRRDGVDRQVLASTLVPGDVILLAEGDRICADARLLEGSLEVDLSTLTGESLPALRSALAVDAGASLLAAPNLVFSGTAATGGEAVGLVVRTGMATELGRIAALTQRVQRDPSPLERQVRRVAWLISAVGVGVALAFIPLGIALAGLSWHNSVNFAIGLIVANVPEGLLPTITLALAVAVREMARRGALVKRLSAVETLGSTSVICTDKTGTLTENRMAAVLVWTAGGERPLDAALATTPGSSQVDPCEAALAEVLRRANSTTVVPAGQPMGDPTDVALMRAADLLAPRSSPGYGTRLAMYHFDPGLRLMSTIDAESRGPVVHTKGAPEEVLARATAILGPSGRAEPLDEATRARVSAAIASAAGRGLRLIAAGSRELAGQPLPAGREQAERELTLVGFVGLLDPARPEVAAAVASCHDAGLRVIVLTGDHRLTAGEIARQVGIGGAEPVTVNAADLDALSEAQLDALLSDRPELVIARSSPETKMRVTDALRADGHVVAMTGDGVNDAPALRRADIGVAMGLSGTDVAREAATMILTDDNFATIVSAVQAGRRVYDNVGKFITYIFAHATPEVIPFLILALSGGRVPLPITVLQILAIDIGTETLPALALGREPAEPGLMARPPRPASQKLIGADLLLRAWGLLGGVSAVLVVGAFFWVLTLGGWSAGADVSASSPLHHCYLQATTMTFLAIVACQVGTAFATRTQHASLWSVGLVSNPLLLAGIAFEIAFSAVIVAVPAVAEPLGMAPPPAQCLAVLPAFAVIVWSVDEAVRAVRRLHSRTLSRSAGSRREPAPRTAGR